ncbi:MAG: GAP family protein [Limnochordales bacterium]
MSVLPPFFGLALVDSINPSALLVTLYLLRRPMPVRTVAAYMSGVFASYLTIGILLVLGLDALLDRFGDALWSPGAYAVQLVIGAAMLVYSYKPVRSDAAPAEQRAAGAATLAGLFALGVAVTVVELTTALPYLAATGLLTYLQWPAAQWLAALVAYNLVFVAPPFALLGLHLVLGRRFEGRMESIRKKLERTGQEAVLWIIGIVGFYLVLDALIYFDFFGLAEVTLADGARSPSELMWRER